MITEQLDRSKRIHDGTAEHIDFAGKQTKHLEKLNRSMFIPVIGKAPGSNNKNAASEHQQQQQQASDSWGGWLNYLGMGGGNEEPPKQPKKTFAPRTASLLDPAAQKPAYRSEGYGSTGPTGNGSFPASKQYEAQVGDWATQEERELSQRHEAEIDKNLDIISGALNQLKFAGLAMQEETERQNKVISQLQDDTTQSGQKLNLVDKKLKKQLAK
jgi:hypothetical protein